MIKEEGHFVLKLPGDPKYVGIVRLAVSGLASRLQFTYEDVEDLKLAVAEACTHAIEHGHGQEISVECQVQDAFLSLCVSHKGTIPEENDDLGVFLIKSLMDEVNFQHSNGQGTRLFMKKYFREKK